MSTNSLIQYPTDTYRPTQHRQHLKYTPHRYTDRPDQHGQYLKYNPYRHTYRPAQYRQHLKYNPSRTYLHQAQHRQHLIETLFLVVLGYVKLTITANQHRNIGLTRADANYN